MFAGGTGATTAPVPAVPAGSGVVPGTTTAVPGVATSSGGGGGGAAAPAPSECSGPGVPDAVIAVVSDPVVGFGRVAGRGVSSAVWPAAGPGPLTEVDGAFTEPSGAGLGGTGAAVGAAPWSWVVAVVGAGGGRCNRRARCSGRGRRDAVRRRLLAGCARGTCALEAPDGDQHEPDRHDRAGQRPERRARGTGEPLYESPERRPAKRRGLFGGQAEVTSPAGSGNRSRGRGEETNLVDESCAVGTGCQERPRLRGIGGPKVGIVRRVLHHQDAIVVRVVDGGFSVHCHVRQTTSVSHEFHLPGQQIAKCEPAAMDPRLHGAQ